MATRIDRRILKRRIDRHCELATLPKAVMTVGSLIDRGASAAEVASEIADDQVLAAKVLRLVNSGFCGFRSRVTSIPHATVLLGFDALRMLVYGTTVMDLADGVRKDMLGFWEHAVGTARAASVLAERLGVPKPEEIGVAGLMHDIGKVVIAQVVPDAFAEIRTIVHDRDCLQIEAEREVLDATHLEVGEWMTTAWSLPDRLVQPVAHHNDFRADRDHADWTAIVHLADIICRAKGVGHSGDRRLPAIDREAWDLLAVDMTDVEDDSG